MKQRNVFLKGIVGDLANNYVKPDSWVFPTHGIRIYNKKGQAYLVTSQLGNEEFIDLGDGHVVIAAKEHRNIVYIVSVYQESSKWITEIGCYPYPKAWQTQTPDNSITGFDNVYGYLRNFIGYTYGYRMRTPLFNYNTNSNLKLIIDDAFDESVNLYLCDGVNMDKVVNSGFLRTGKLNNVIYKENDFYGKLNHILYSLKPVSINNVSVPVGGELPPGQYHVFFAYKTASYDKTEYFSESFPISVAEGDSITGVYGETDTKYNQEKNLTRKKIVLTLSGLDTDYKYISVALIRFYSNGDGFVQHEQFEIASDHIIPKNFSITDELTIEITGREDKVIISEEEFQSLYLKERISKDHCFYNSRIFKANLKSTSYNKTIFENLALLVTVESFTTTDIVLHGYDDIVHKSTTEKLSTQDPEFIYDKLSYFENEVYPFGVTFLLSNGITTDPYPITGKNEDNPTETNTSGLFKFKRNTDRLSVIGVKMNIASILAEINNNPVYSDIIGFKIVRGKRISNMLYDGVLERTANGVTISKNRKTDNAINNMVYPFDCLYYDKTDLWFASESKDNAYHVPVFRYGHVLDNVEYPRTTSPDANHYSFPHATYNDNGNDRSKTVMPLPNFLRDMANIVPQHDPVYEYSIAVEHPGVIIDSDKSSDHGDSNNELELHLLDALDTELKISETHFALFSPDFMTETEHLTEDGETYYMKIYDKYSGNQYSEGTSEYQSLRSVPEINNPNPPVIPSRTRVLELNPHSDMFTTFVRDNIEILCGTEPSSVDLTKWKLCPGTVTIKDYNKDIFYHAAIGSQTAPNIGVQYSQSQVSLHVVKYTDNKEYLCIKDTEKDSLNGEDTSPNSPDPNNLGPWWLLIDSITLYKQEYSTNDFRQNPPLVPPAVQDGSLWVRPSCVSHEYTLNITPLTPFVETVKIYNIEKGVYKGTGKFSSYAEDGKEYQITGKKGLYSLTGEMINRTAHLSAFTGLMGATMRSTMIHYNRSYQTPGYIGVIFDDNGAFGSSYKKEDVYMVKLYKYYPDPDPVNSRDLFFDNMLADFDPKYEQYWNISNLIKREETDSSIELFKGDNFKTLSWFRMAHHVDFDDNKEDGHPSRGFQAWYVNDNISDLQFSPHEYLRSSYFLDKSYNHGILYGIMTSNRHNVNLRSLLRVLNKDKEELQYTFFPNVANSRDPLGWIYSSSDESDLVESLNINDGYNDVDGFVKKTGVDVDTPYDSKDRKTAIAFSERRVVNSFKDGYRAMYAANSVDYETNYGDIIRIEELFGMLITAREKAVFKHFVGKKDITKDVEFNTSSIFLSNETLLMLYYGIQDWSALIKTKSAIYAVDVDNAMILRITMETSATGSNNLSPALLSKMFMIEKKTKELTDILEKVRTTTFNKNGISLGYNEEYGEVYFTFMNGDNIETLVFDEDRKFFIGTSPLRASLYTPFKKGVLETLDASEAHSGVMYQDNIDNGTVMLYGSPTTNKLSFIVNGNTEQENSVILTKIFESLSISSPHKVLNKILYETELQRGEYIFTEDSAEFWKDSEWIEGSWLTPIIRENVSDNDNYYEDDSIFRGKWLKITLEFQGDSEFYITEIISQFKQSFS